MPSSTFTNLKPEKRQRIFQALLTEFSQYPLSQSQVARIVKQADIARGSFYKYFTNLLDAYQYVLQQSIFQLHTKLAQKLTVDNQDTIANFYHYTVEFAHQLKTSQYKDFYRLFWQENQYYLQSHAAIEMTNFKFFQHLTLKVANQAIKNPRQNQVIIQLLRQVSHEAIKEILSGQDEEQVLQNLKIILKVISAGLQQEEG
ncbi:TetR/AcrR family transcriptional regulator [Bombilactobacillus bombi]|uniref:TetR/AcrR family transcriptional regulator n=1 Tax=Bombilactobacillus bombi TaxID=1303590 RepID=A0A3R7CQ23_9LACO|nr:TetR/AcrR family transcriptional regulator [Bombilactobacillus bombi]RHW51819.1 TetR/AcrR family transcriptional regulator [Bombilactobacillus bombi]